MNQLRISIVLAFIALGSGPNLGAAVSVEVLRVPHDGIQPRIEVGSSGTLHMIYYKGDPVAGDIFYVKQGVGSKVWSEPIQVNQRASSAVAAGSIRGPQMALGENERVHVAWMGSGKVSTPGKEGEHPKPPMLYTRLADDGGAFEMERDLLSWTAGLDGGGTVAANSEGHVYVAWHGKPEDSSPSEFGRAVYVSRSSDQGKTFSRETMANPDITGACGCCGMRGFVDRKGQLYLLYRMANEVNRDMGLLFSKDQGQSFSLQKVSEWQIQACPMSSAAFVEGQSGVLISTETEGHVELRQVNSSTRGLSTLPGLGRREGKHPSISVNQHGDLLFVWSEGAGWKKGGILRWRNLDQKGQPIADSGELSLSIPEWSFAAAASKPDGNFVLIY